MSRLIFATLFSGSSGNAVYISLDDIAILIDAGKNTRAIENALFAIGEDPKKIKAVFVTHEHSDHVSALPVLTKKYGIPVHIEASSAAALDVFPVNAVVHRGEFEEQVGPFTVTSFAIPHDSASAMGYIVSAANRRIGIATDMGMLAKSVVAKLSGCTEALIECNYDPDMLKTGVYPPYLKARIAGKGGHLSNADGALLAAVLAYTGTKNILLGHLSKENNTPEKALAAVTAEFEKRAVSAKVSVALRDEPTVLLNETL